MKSLDDPRAQAQAPSRTPSHPPSRARGAPRISAEQLAAAARVLHYWTQRHRAARADADDRPLPPPTAAPGEARATADR